METGSRRTVGEFQRGARVDLKRAPRETDGALRRDLEGATRNAHAPGVGENPIVVVSTDPAVSRSDFHDFGGRGVAERRAGCQELDSSLIGHREAPGVCPFHATDLSSGDILPEKDGDVIERGRAAGDRPAENLEILRDGAHAPKRAARPVQSVDAPGAEPKIDLVTIIKRHVPVPAFAIRSDAAAPVGVSQPTIIDPGSGPRRGLSEGIGGCEADARQNRGDGSEKGLHACCADWLPE